MLHVLPPTFKPVNNLICYQTGFKWVVKRRNIAIQLNLQQYCKTSCVFLLPVFSVPSAYCAGIYRKK